MKKPLVDALYDLSRKDPVGRHAPESGLLHAAARALAISYKEDAVGAAESAIGRFFLCLKFEMARVKGDAKGMNDALALMTDRFNAAAAKVGIGRSHDAGWFFEDGTKH